MPKDIIDYSNTIIYKIFCNDTDVKYTYIGHTTNFIKRKYQHKILCSSSKKLKIYDIIRKNGGWNNWNMIEIAKYNCQDSTEARIREQEHYDLLKPTLNTVKPISNNEYCILSIDNQINDDKDDDDTTDENKNRFSCKSCNYNTCKKSSYDDHLLSNKHKRLAFGDKGDANSAFLLPTHICENCNKKYKSRNGLWKHKKNCVKILDDTYDDDKSIQKSDSLTDKDLIMMLIKDNNELRKMMMEQQSLMIESNNKVLDLCKNGTHNTTNTHTNSHNKAFNLNFFLNETCKNAMNIMDFAESIQLQVSDLEKVGELGYIEGISNIIVQNLKALDVTERPIHCTDKKRETIYIKDENKWEKEDDTKKKLRKVISKVARKNERLLPKYREKYPGCQFAESKHADEYNKIVIESLGGMGNNEAEKEDKIIRNIAKVVTIDKNYGV
jgi:hypothetical protein